MPMKSKYVLSRIRLIAFFTVGLEFYNIIHDMILCSMSINKIIHSYDYVHTLGELMYATILVGLMSLYEIIIKKRQKK